MSDFHFVRPEWLLALIPAVVLLGLLWRRRDGETAWKNVCDPELLKHLWLQQPGAVSRMPLGLLALGWALAVIALAGPVWDKTAQPIYRAESARVLVLDLSPSMAAADVAPSRLKRAGFKIKDILERSSEVMTGLVVFAGQPHTVTPLTDDMPTIANLMQAMATDLVPVKGDAAGPALAHAGALLKQTAIEDGEILVITDGVADITAALREARALRKDGVRVSVLGVGTAAGAPIPGVQPTTLARLDIGPLRALAQAGGGTFSTMTADDRDLRRVLGASVSFDSKVEEREDNGLFEQWIERGPFVLPVLLILGAFAFRRGWIAAIAFAILLPAAQPARASGWSDLWQRRDQQAAQALENGDPEKAAELFDDPAWQGMAHFKAGDFDKAAQAFAQAEGADADYNRGNALARAGQLEEAIKAYREAIETEPDHADAKANLAAIEALLKQNQDQQQNEQGDGEESDGDQEQGAPQSGQNGQNGQQDGQSRDGQDEQSQDTESQTGEEHGDSSQSDQQSGETGEGETAKEQPEGQPGGEETDEEQDPHRAGMTSEEGNGEQEGEEGQEGAVFKPGEEGDETPSEADLAVEQWLNRIPDNPGGLLRRKFILEHRRRQQEAGER